MFVCSLLFQNKIPGVGFLKIHAPWEVLCREAEFMKLKMPTVKASAIPISVYSLLYTHLTSSCHFQKFEVRTGNDIVEKFHKFMHKVTAPLRPKVGNSGTENEKHLSYPFSREKQHL